MTRWRALGGVLGPAAFVAGWAALGAHTEGYSPAEDPISRLAAIDAPSRAVMTGALLAYAVGLSLFAPELRRTLAGPAAASAGLNVIGTLGIAATPLDSFVGGAPHAVAAGLSYISLGAMPILASGPLARHGHLVAARASGVAGGCALGALAISAFGTDHTGLWQRTGLTIGDLWIMTSAAWVLRGRAHDHVEP